MNKFTKRSITTKIDVPTDFHIIGHSPIEKEVKETEKLQDLQAKPHCGYRRFESEESVHVTPRHRYLNFNTNSSSCGNSSGSSESWSEELDKSGGRILKKNFDNVERFLYDESEIDENHAEEYNQWKSTFAHLRVVGNRCKLSIPLTNTPVTSTEEEIIAVHSDSSDRNICDNQDDLKRKLKDAVVTKICDTLNSKRSQTDLNETVFLYNKRESQPNVCQTYVDNLSKDFASYLNIKPASLFHQNTKIASPNSIMHSTISASKWQRNTNEYSSLPHINQSPMRKSNLYKQQKSLEVRRGNSSRFKSDIKSPTYSKSILLPPINAETRRGHTYRSISATPRKYQLLSATKKKLDSMFREGESRIEIASYLSRTGEILNVHNSKGGTLNRVHTDKSKSGKF